MMAILSVVVSFVFAAGVQAQNAAYAQCGGIGWCYNIDCQPGYVCTPQSRNPYYSQCLLISVPTGDLAPYVGCGPPSTSPCSPGYACVASNGYAQCVPIIYNSLTTVNTCLATQTSVSSSTMLSTTSTSTVQLPGSSSATTVKSTTTSAGSSTSSTLTKSTSSSSSKLSSAVITSTSGSNKAATSSSLVGSKSTSSTSSTKSSSSSKNPTSTSTLTTLLTSTSTTASVPAQQTPYGQCGGIGWTGPTTCTSGWACIPQAGNPYYSQCLPGSNSQPPPTTTTTTGPAQSPTPATMVFKSSTTLSTQTGVPGTCLPTSQSCGITNSPPSCAGKVKLAGINIAGCDFGTDTNGYQSPSGAYCPIGPYNPNGPGQMSHFASENFNIFRLPTGWQFIINSVSATATLDPTNFGNYNNLVQACLSTGAYCLIDIHNYARFNGAIIGQGGPSDAVFAQLWANIATFYASNPKVVFGIMNEPHDLPSITTWAQTVQAVVTAIRNAGATSQMILLPGNDWTGAGNFVSDGSGPALSTVTNPDGSTTNLIFDVHKYLDSDGSGTSSICVSDEVASAFAPLAQWLRCNGRQAILSETGGSSDPSCLGYLCSAVKFLNANSDVYLGVLAKQYIGWAAGSFSTGYNIGETPSYSNGVWTDQLIVTKCLLR